MSNLSYSITEIIENKSLRGSLYSTFRCSFCGKKLLANALGNHLRLECEDYSNYESYKANNGKYVHDSFDLNLSEVAAILNFNPLL